MIKVANHIHTEGKNIETIFDNGSVLKINYSLDYHMNHTQRNSFNESMRDIREDIYRSGNRITIYFIYEARNAVSIKMFYNENKETKQYSVYDFDYTFYKKYGFKTRKNFPNTILVGARGSRHTSLSTIIEKITDWLYEDVIIMYPVAISVQKDLRVFL